MSEETMPTYAVGDTISVAVEVRSWLPRRGICRVHATFVHEADSTRELAISSDPEHSSDVQVQTGDEVELRGQVIARAHPVGEYHLKEMAAEYPGRRIVRFADVPDMRFEVVEEKVKSPEISAWRWL